MDAGAMTQDKRAEIVEAVLRAWHSEVADCADPECEACNRAASAVLDVVLKAVAEITDAEMAVLIRDAKIAVETGDDAAHYRANPAWWSDRRVRKAILALISEGLK